MEIINLRKRTGSIRQIAQWHFDEWHELYPQKAIGDFENDLKESLSDAAIPQIWLLMDREEICGTASALEHDMTINTDLSPWLANIFIKKEKRGLGLGKTIVQHVMGEIKALGFRDIYLFTEDQHSFYEKFGWTVLKRELYEGKAVVIMKHTL